MSVANPAQKEIDPLVLKITNLKVEASQRGMWQTVKALDMAERGYVADHIRITRETQRCDYCWGGNSDGPGPETDLKEIELRSGSGHGVLQWSEPRWTGERCRRYLRGLFRYTLKRTAEYDPFKRVTK